MRIVILVIAVCMAMEMKFSSVTKIAGNVNFEPCGMNLSLSTDEN